MVGRSKLALPKTKHLASEIRRGAKTGSCWGCTPPQHGHHCLTRRFHVSMPRNFVCYCCFDDCLMGLKKGCGTPRAQGRTLQNTAASWNLYQKLHARPTLTLCNADGFTSLALMNLPKPLAMPQVVDPQCWCPGSLAAGGHQGHRTGQSAFAGVNFHTQTNLTSASYVVHCTASVTGEESQAHTFSS